MSRSHRKRPFIGMTTAPSDKDFKVAEHQRERQNARQILSTTRDDTDPRLHRTFGNPALAPKDGKQRTSERRRLRK